MSEVRSITADVDAWLAVNKYNVDADGSHIVIDADADIEEFRKLVKVCPAGLYRINDRNEMSFDCSGCLECGTCRIACGDTIVKSWENPRPMMGVQYRFG